MGWLLNAFPFFLTINLALKELSADLCGVAKSTEDQILTVGIQKNTDSINFRSLDQDKIIKQGHNPAKVCKKFQAHPTRLIGY